jgi:uncharacterized protein (TIGR04222 family)
MDVVLIVLSGVLGTVTVSMILTVEARRLWTRLSLRGAKDPELGYYEAAYLSGGPVRVVDTALGLLTREGEIRVSKGGRLHQVSTATSAGYPVEDAILASVHKRSGIPAVMLKRDVAASAPVKEIQYRLLDKGLLVTPHGGGLFDRCESILRAVPPVTLAAIVVNVALMAFLGSSALMTAALLAFGANWLVAKRVSTLYQRDMPIMLSRAGRHYLQRARKAHAYGVVGDAVAMPLALYGLSHLGDAGLSKELRRGSIPDGHLYPTQAGGPRDPGLECGSGSSGGSDYSGPSCGGGSGCGGGGCGGGGGGCGGGGGGCGGGG